MLTDQDTQRPEWYEMAAPYASPCDISCSVGPHALKAKAMSVRRAPKHLRGLSAMEAEQTETPHLAAVAAIAVLFAVTIKYTSARRRCLVEQARAMKLIPLMFVALCVSATYAFGQSPYFGQREKVELRDVGEVEFGILFGDGIIFADPSQVIAFDSDGHLLAATPLSDALIIRCNPSNLGQSCSAYDVVRGLIYDPDPDQWVRGRLIVEGGRPSRDAYPEYMDISYGFIERPATIAEKISFEIAGMAHAPGSTLFAIFWWCLALLPIARLFWRWRVNEWRIESVRFSGVFAVLLSLLVFLAMGLLALISVLHAPYSLLFFLFVFTLGGTAAFLFTWPWGKRVAKQSP